VFNESSYIPFNLIPGEFIYVYSDEQTHIWLNSGNDTLYIVDMGSQILGNGYNALMQDIPTIQTINIFITHCHIDHHQSLPGFINKTTGKKIVLYIDQNTAPQFLAFLMENYNFVSTNGTFLFSLVLTNENTFSILTNSTMNVLAIQHNRFAQNQLMHFLTDTTWVFAEPKRCMKIISGDFNPPSPTPDLPTLRNDIKMYFQQVYNRVTTLANYSCVYFFWDYGHFLNPLENYNQTLYNNITAIDSNNVNITSNYFWEHYKQTSGYMDFRIFLDDNNTRNYTMEYISPPGYLRGNSSFLYLSIVLTIVLVILCI